MTPEMPPENWVEALVQARTVLRQRDYAYRTEQSDLGWLEGFRGFEQERPILAAV